jgi:Fe-S cluster assembly protein SufD
MIDTKEEKNIYLSNFGRLEKEVGADSWLHRIRRAAIQRFSELGFPTTRNEDWRFTKVEPIAKMPFRPALASESNGVALDQVEQATFRIPEAIRLVFVNGHFSSQMSSTASDCEGITVANLGEILSRRPEWVEPYLARYANYDAYPFTALNTAFILDGAFISVSKGKVTDKPIHVIYAATARGEGCVAHPRTLLLAGPHSQVRLVETYCGLEENAYFTNAVSEIIAADGAIVDHTKVQRESEEAFHIGTVQVYQAKSSNFTSHLISLGGGLVRNETRVALDAEGCESTLDGLYLARGRQHVDNHTVIDHAKPHCASHELYKGILDERAHGVFNGKIFVHQDAQKTDAKQTNQTLLLSEDAVINTKPQLEIYADDVKCTHGATVGQLQDEAIFYLRSRGLGEDAARNLLTFAFANELVERLKIDALRDQLQDFLLRKQHLARPEAP